MDPFASDVESRETTSDYHSDHEAVFLLRAPPDRSDSKRGKEDAEEGRPRSFSVSSNNPTTGAFVTFFNITKCFVGAASFELPWAFKEAGLLGGCLGLLVLAFFSFYTLIILAKCGRFAASLLHKQTATKENHSRSSKVITYPDIGRACFGRAGAFAAWFGILAMTVGVCGSYLVFMGSSLSHLLSPYGAFFRSTIACTAMVLPLVIGLSWLRSLRVLAPTSVLGILALLFSLVVTIVDGARHESITWKAEEEEEAETMLMMFRVKTYPLFLGNAAFLYLIHSVILPTEQAMKDRSKYKISLAAAMLFVTVLNLCFAVICLLFWKENTAQNIIDNLSHGVITTLVRIFLSIDLLFTFALFLFPVSEALEHNFFNPSLFGRSWKEEMKRNALRAVLVIATAGVALSIPFFSLLTGLSGVFGNNLLGFLLPTLLYVFLSHRFGHWDLLLTSSSSLLDEVDNDHYNYNDEALIDKDDETKEKKKKNKTRSRRPTLRRLFVGQQKSKAWLRFGEFFLCFTIFTLGLAMMGLGIHAFVREITKEYS
ncbi:Transmembrane amino acid transporter protein [Balamuthia mandrillaris]